MRDGSLGIQSLIVRREALIMRHALRLLLYPNSLLSLPMVAKYGPQTLTADIRLAWSSSFMQKKICARAMRIMSQIRQVVGDGRTVDFLHDPWLLDLSLSILSLSMQRVGIPRGSRISDLLHSKGGGWHFDRVVQPFAPNLVERMLFIVVLIHDDRDMRV